MIALVCPCVDAAAQSATDFDRERGRTMLHVVSTRLQREYYDPSFHGVDLKASVRRADSMIGQAQSNSAIFSIIAQVVLQLDDSHTRFDPPDRAAAIEYGVDLQMIGDQGFIVDVDRGSDAAKRGVAIGDRVVAVDGWVPNRREFQLYRYFYLELSPRSVVHVELESPGGERRGLDLAARVTEGKRIIDLWGPDRGVMEREWEDRQRRWRDEYRGLGDVLIWRMAFFGEPERMDEGVDRAKGAATLILDLRSNPGGLEKSLWRLASRFVERETMVGTRVRRSGREAIVVRPRGPRFEGQLIVLIDSRSSSASELFARFVQQARLGTVVGDRSAGLVLRSRYYPMSIGTGIVVPYGISISDAIMLMADGQSLEKVGVTPDELLLPTGADLAAGRDPVLARALALAGKTIDAATAARLVPPVERN